MTSSSKRPIQNAIYVNLSFDKLPLDFQKYLKERMETSQEEWNSDTPETKADLIKWFQETVDLTVTDDKKDELKQETKQEPSSKAKMMPKNQGWLMTVMHSLGYLRCDLVVLPSFDSDNFQTFHSSSNFVYVISNNKLYFVDQINHSAELILNDQSEVQKILATFNIGETESKNTRVIENLSLKQINFIELITYTDTLWGGICRGITVMSAPANLLGKNEVLRFNRRLKLASMMLPQRGIDIDLESEGVKEAVVAFNRRFEMAKLNVIQNKNQAQYSNSLDDVIYERISSSLSLEELEKTLNTPEEKLALDKAILEMRNFFDVVVVAQNLNYLKHLTNEPIITQELKPVIPLISPSSLDSKDSNDSQIILIKDDLTGICDKDGLKTVFQILASHFQDIPFSMQFGSPHHDINISYHPDWDEPWVVTDANDLPSKLFKTEDELCEYVTKRLFSGDGLTAYRGEILVLSKDQVHANDALESMMKDPKWLKINEVTPEKARSLTQNSDSWLHCVAFTRNKKLAEKLLEQGADPALANYSATPPYRLATKRDEEIALMMWKKICADFKEIKQDIKTEKGKLINRIAESMNSVLDLESKSINLDLKGLTENTNKRFLEVAELKKRAEGTALEVEIDKTLTKFKTSLGDLHTLGKNLQNAKLSVVRQISIFKELENFIDLIRNKLIDKRIDPIILEHIFDSVYAAFPDRKHMAKELVKIINAWRINLELPNKKFNTLENQVLDLQLPISIAKLKNLIEFITNIAKELRNSCSKDPSDEYDSLQGELLNICILFLNKITSADLDLINYDKFERRILFFFCQYYELMKENKADVDSKILLKIFGDHGIDLEAPNETLLNQFINAIHPKPKQEAKGNTAFIATTLKVPLSTDSPAQHYHDATTSNTMNTAGDSSKASLNSQHTTLGHESEVNKTNMSKSAKKLGHR